MPLFLGSNLIKEDAVHSTNQLLMEMMDEGALLQEGTVVWALEQTAGRGQPGTQWYSAPKENLTFSLLLLPTFLPPTEQFNLSIAVSLGLHDALSELVKGKEVFVKWPNDLYVGSKKVCGMLLENSLLGNRLRRTIVGIGLNLNQRDFGDHLPNATSISLETNEIYLMKETLFKVLDGIESRYLQLRAGKTAQLRADYHQVLFRNGEKAQYKDTQTGEFFEGVIQGVDAHGRLLMGSPTGNRTYGFKEVSVVL